MRIAFNIATSYARFLTGIVAVFFITPFVLGVIGVEQFGLWALCLAVTGVLGLLDMGLSTATVKYVAECSGNFDFTARNEALSTLMVVYSVLGGFCLLLVIAFIPAGIQVFGLEPQQADSFKTVMSITGIAMALAMPLSVFRSALIGAGRFDLVNLVETGSILVNAVIVVMLLLNGWGLTGLAIANASVMLLAPLVLIPIAWRLIPAFRLAGKLVRFKRMGEVAPLAMYFMLANIALLITLRSDALIIKGFLPLTAVAAYAIAAKISEYSYLLNKQFSNALMPLISHSTGAGEQATVRAILVDGTRYLMIIATPLLGLLFFHAEHIVVLWVGPELQAVVVPLRILLAAVLFSTLQLNAANVLGMTGGHRGVAIIMIGSALFNILLSLLLIPRMGLAGAAVSTLAAALILEFGMLLKRACNRQAISLGAVLSGVTPVLLCAAPMLMLAGWMNSRWPVSSFTDLVLQGLVATICYACVISFSGIRRHERTWIIARLKGCLQTRTPPAVFNTGDWRG